MDQASWSSAPGASAGSAEKDMGSKSGLNVTAGAILFVRDIIWIGAGATIPELLISDISLLTFPPSASQSFGRNTPTNSTHTHTLISRFPRLEH